MLAQPRFKYASLHSSPRILLKQPFMRLPVVHRQAISVNPQKYGRGSNRDSFVSVKERMILRKALPKCCGLLEDVRVVPALRTGDCRFQGPHGLEVPEHRRIGRSADRES
jgi:hypothetical protein